MYSRKALEKLKNGKLGSSLLLFSKTTSDNGHCSLDVVTTNLAYLIYRNVDIKYKGPKLLKIEIWRNILYSFIVLNRHSCKGSGRMEDYASQQGIAWKDIAAA